VIEGEEEGGTGYQFHSSSGYVKRRSNDSIFVNAGGDGRQSLVSWNQINISPDSIGTSIIKIARNPKATHKEFAATTVICDAISVAQINQEDRCVDNMISCDESFEVSTPCNPYKRQCIIRRSLRRRDNPSNL